MLIFTLLLKAFASLSRQTLPVIFGAVSHFNRPGYTKSHLSGVAFNSLRMFVFALLSMRITNNTTHVLETRLATMHNQVVLLLGLR
ncbi:hypothetical protein ES703_87197 [subsurface metagenome]